MFNPAFGSDAKNEWIEIKNVSGGSVNINGLIVMEDDGGDGEVTDDITIAAGAYMVLAVSDGVDWVYPFTPDAFYGSLAFGNSGDEVSVIADGTVIDAAPDYDLISISAGASFQLDQSTEDAVDNDNIANWCAGDLVIAGTEADPDYGSPYAGGSCF